MRIKWEEQEKERKNKGKEEEKPTKFTQNSKVSLRIEESREFGGGLGGNWRPKIQCRGLEMPIFEGENPDDWIFRAEQYFEVNQLSENEKVETVALCFKAGALVWFQ